MSAKWNNQSSAIERGQGDIALATGTPAEAETRFRNSIRLSESSYKDAPLCPQPPAVGSMETQTATIRLLLAHSLHKQNTRLEAEVETRRAVVDFLRL